MFIELFELKGEIDWNIRINLSLELPFPDFITTLCIMKTINPENDRSFVVNPEFRDNPEKWYFCFKFHQSIEDKRRMRTWSLSF